MSTLRKHASRRVNRVSGACVKLAVVDGRCTGGWLLTDHGVITVHASATVLATGGVGGLFASTTNPPGATGDGIMLAWEAGAGLADLEFVQFHPTALDAGNGEQRVLVTEALRGAGAHVVDSRGNRFLFEVHSDGELAPRDIVARAISERRSFLDCRHLDADLLRREFPTVTKGCEPFGLDLSSDLIPVTPAAHYFVGGITTDLDGRTSIPRLYAVGECANTGAHGANRLAGNSLAEALVFARRAAKAIAGQRTASVKSFPAQPSLVGTGRAEGAAWRSLRAACTGGLGVKRTPQKMSEITELLAPDGPLAPGAGLELRGAVTVARLIARSASLRDESRGVHFRTDRPRPNPAWAGVRLRVARD
jgi:L-aspartate oxidase